MRRILPPTLWLIMLLVLYSCGESSKPIPIVSYSIDVKPILDGNCLHCHNKHGDGYKISGLNMESYSSLMAGTKYGPIIVPGNSLNSTLVSLINNKADPALSMPHGKQQLISAQNRKLISIWVDQGAKDN